MANSGGRRIAQQLASVVGRAAVKGARSWLRNRDRGAGQGPGSGSRSGSGSGSGSGAPSTDGAARGADYPGDFSGTPTMVYAPHPDGRPDPGEIVWTWVPYEEDHSQGKDRPVLLIGHDQDWLLALQLTSKDHDRDSGQEARAGRYWVDIGSGGWDSRGRPSEVRVNRILRVDPAGVRREGAVLPKDRFAAVADAVRASSGAG